MRIVVQRVSSASVSVDDRVVGRIGAGLLLLIGVGPGDDQQDLAAVAKKLVEMRIFGDDDGKMNRSVLDIGGDVLAVSQFTLFADTRRGRRPSFTGAAPPAVAKPVFDELVGALQDTGIRVETGVFGARMDVSLVNDGPVTLILDLDPPALGG